MKFEIDETYTELCEQIPEPAMKIEYDGKGSWNTIHYTDESTIICKINYRHNA